MSNYQPMTDEELDTIFPPPKPKIPSEPMITIPKKLYDMLWQDHIQLKNLEENGVDNWQGYSYKLVEDDDDN